VAVAVLILVSSGLPAETGGSKPVAGIIKLLLGGALLFLASRQWRSGRAAAGEPKLPKWMSAIDTMTPVRRLVPGFLLSAVDPKNLLLGASVGAAQLDLASTVVVTVVFNVVAAVTPAAASQRNDAARALRRFFTELRLAR
jgi:threonine/homoserine/homoserine lactone efflux protein